LIKSKLYLETLLPFGVSTFPLIWLSLTTLLCVMLADGSV